MGFNWSLDAADDEPVTPVDQQSPFEALGFTAGSLTPETFLDAPSHELDEAPLASSFALEPYALEPIAPPAVATPAPLTRRELRMAALAGTPIPTAPAAVNQSSSYGFASVEVASPEARRRAAVSARITASRPPKKSLRRRVLPKLLSIGAMFGAAAFLVASTVPANAFMGSPADQATVATHLKAQSLGAVNAKAVAQTSARDKYTVLTLAEQYAITYASTNWSYTNDPNGTIQWPFPVQVPIATGFGPRQVAGCSFCSTFHEGVDFDPGMGAPIGAIADGIVTDVVNSHSGLGNHVVISHVIKGQKIDSVYAHMLDGSIKVAIGDHVKVAQIIGQVGSTGESTGAHLHLEIHLDGVPIDPFAWLKANAN